MGWRRETRERENERGEKENERGKREIGAALRVCALRLCSNSTQSRVLGTLFPFAHNKLAAEEALHMYHVGPARLNYLVVRTAPLVGARDTTFAALSDDAKRFDRKVPTQVD